MSNASPEQPELKQAETQPPEKLRSQEMLFGRSPAVDRSVSQERKNRRQLWPAWAKDLPRRKIVPDPEFQLIDRKRFSMLLNSIPVKDDERRERIRKTIEEDLEHLDKELLWLFRENDYRAKDHQNRYRQYQLSYILLAMAATIVGAFQALAVGKDIEWLPPLPYIAFLETAIALTAAYLATISGRESPINRWMNHRRRAESLRQEYYRYLMHAAPYNMIEEDYDRRMTLALRAALINKGEFPSSERKTPDTPPSIRGTDPINPPPSTPIGG